MKKLRIGMIGAGNIAKVHLEAYKNVPDAEIVAICDINRENLDEAAELYNIPNRYDSVEEMLANCELDAADVCIWNCDHAKCAIAALNAGLHVLCEKPMAYNAQEAEAMKKAAQDNGKLLMIGFVLRFGNGEKVAKDFIDNGYLGDIYHTKATYLRRHGAPGGWFCRKELSGGGPVIDLGVHVIDLTRYLMGNPKPVSVYAVTNSSIGNRPYLNTNVSWMPKGASDTDPYEVEDFGTAIIRYDNGATTLLEASYNMNGDTTTKTEYFGTKGGIKVDADGMKIFTVINDYLADVTPKIDNLKNGGDLFVEEMKHFTDCALNGTACIATADDGITIMKILDAIYESARTGHEVIL